MPNESSPVSGAHINRTCINRFSVWGLLIGGREPRVPANGSNEVESTG